MTGGSRLSRHGGRKVTINDILNPEDSHVRGVWGYNRLLAVASDGLVGGRFFRKAGDPI